MTERQLDEAAFMGRFPLLSNHLAADAPFEGCMFETYGDEHAFVREQDPRCIWTVLTGDNDELTVVSGYWRVNRLGHLVSKVPVAIFHTYYVTLDIQVDEEIVATT